MGANSDDTSADVEGLLHSPSLAGAIESEQFRDFLDHIPFGLAVASLRPGEPIVYCNPTFEKLTGRPSHELLGQTWTAIQGALDGVEPGVPLGAAVIGGRDFVGTFRLPGGAGVTLADVYANVIEDEDGTPLYRLTALVDVTAHEASRWADIAQELRHKDLLLQELQHRVRNNLQLITSLIRLEARNAAGALAPQFDRLAGRMEALQLLYSSLSVGNDVEEIDLGVYLSQVASAVMRSHGVPGIRLDLKVDTYLVSVNVAMPAGLVVNELMTNALKHAFKEREHGTITLHSLADDKNCRVVVADDGVGLPDGFHWPARGNLGALIVKALTENAKGTIETQSAPSAGTRVTVVFTRRAAAPHPEVPLVQVAAHGGSFHPAQPAG